MNKSICIICKQTRAVLAKGVCEPCAFETQWEWRNSTGSGFADTEPSKKVTVLIARRKSTNEIKLPIELNTSYEFLTMDAELPSLDVLEGDNNFDTIKRILRRLGIISWDSLIKPFYSSYLPHGKHSTVFIVGGWSQQDLHAPEPVWVSWPLSTGMTTLKPFHEGIDLAWSLWLYKHACSPISDPCVQVREVAARFIDLKISSHTDKTKDSSMLPMLQHLMTEDECLIAKDVLKPFEGEEILKKIHAQKITKPTESEVINWEEETRFLEDDTDEPNDIDGSDDKIIEGEFVR
jgi:hypothetical protein